MYSVKRVETTTSFNIPKNNAFLKGMVTFTKLFDDIPTFTFDSCITKLHQDFDYQKHVRPIVSDTILTPKLMLVLLIKINNSDELYSSKYTAFIEIDYEMKSKLSSKYDYVMLTSSTRSFIAGFVSGLNQILGSRRKIQLWIAKNNKVYSPKVIYLTDLAIEARKFKREHPNIWDYYYWQCSECSNYNYPGYNHCEFCHKYNDDTKCNVRIELSGIPLVTDNKMDNPDIKELMDDMANNNTNNDTDAGTVSNTNNDLSVNPCQNNETNHSSIEETKYLTPTYNGLTMKQVIGRISRFPKDNTLARETSVETNYRTSILNLNLDLSETVKHIEMARNNELDYNINNDGKTVTYTIPTYGNLSMKQEVGRINRFPRNNDNSLDQDRKILDSMEPFEDIDNIDEFLNDLDNVDNNNDRKSNGSIESNEFTESPTKPVKMKESYVADPSHNKPWMIFDEDDDMNALLLKEPTFQ